MLTPAEEFWKSIEGKIRSLVEEEMQNSFQCERYDVTTDPDGSVIGVTQPFGETELFIPYSQEVSTATVGDTVLVVWWGGMSNAKAYYFADGYRGNSGGGGGGHDLPAGGSTGQMLVKNSNTSYDAGWGDNAYRTSSIPYGICDPTSTSTVFTAVVPGITELRDGVCVWLKNGVVTSAAGFTININGLGAKPSYSNLAAATADTTLFNVNYTMLFVYDSTRVAGGCWVCYRGYDSNTNTIGYQLRTNSYTLPATDKFYRYRLLFTSADGTHWVPANTSTSTNATASRTPNTKPINPFGEIVYYGSTTVINAEANPSATVLWQQYVFSLGYSFNTTGSALTLTYPAPVYIKCIPQSDGSAILDGYTQVLPTTEDGKIYILLGYAYSDTNVEIILHHPVYQYLNGHIQLYTNGPVIKSGTTVPTTSDLADGEIYLMYS